ncbi:unnamed protein product [Symbiodinium sp. CCMP2456]|nr:unnamed protein product [Symbiodinium sp. CCMP2456]
MFPTDWLQSPRCLPQDGGRSSPTWPSARFPRTSLRAPQPQRATSASRSCPPATQLLAMMAIIGMFFQVGHLCNNAMR